MFSGIPDEGWPIESTLQGTFHSYAHFWGVLFRPDLIFSGAYRKESANEVSTQVAFAHCRSGTLHLFHYSHTTNSATLPISSSRFRNNVCVLAHRSVNSHFALLHGTKPHVPQGDARSRPTASPLPHSLSFQGSRSRSRPFMLRALPNISAQGPRLRRLSHNAERVR